MLPGCGISDWDFLMPTDSGDWAYIVECIGVRGWVVLEEVARLCAEVEEFWLAHGDQVIRIK